MAEWFVYVLVSEQNGRTYVGSSTDVARRLRQHNGKLRGGAKCTRAHRPWKIGRVVEGLESRSAAFKEEKRIKRLRKRRLYG